MQKKAFRTTAILLIAILIMSCSAFALADNQSVLAASVARFDFWIQANGPSGHSSTSAYKSDAADAAYAICAQNTAYWPSNGVTLRVRNESLQYATEAVNFGNGEGHYLSYLSGQNYRNNKWLYGSITDPYSTSYSINVTGTWTP